MTTIDLASYDLNGLKELNSNIEKEIKSRQEQGLKEARDQILAIAQNLGVSVEDLLTSKKPKLAGTKVQAQYRNPDNGTQTWSGRGRQPKWIAAGLAEGFTLDDFRIQ